jgi:hypothetical protein
MVLVGHCTRNDWALAVNATKKTTTARKQKLLAFLLAIRPTFAAPVGGCVFAVTAAPIQIQALTAATL